MTLLLLKVSKQDATFSGSNIYRVNHRDQQAGPRATNYISYCLIDVPCSILIIYSTVKRLSGLRVLSTGRQETVFDGKKKPEWRRYVLFRKQVCKGGLFFLDRSLLTLCHEVINIGVTSGLYWNSVGLKSLPTIDTRSLGQE